MSYARVEKRAAELEAEVARWLAPAAAVDAEEVKIHGATRTGDEMPKWVADKKSRAEKIRQAKAEAKTMSPQKSYANGKVIGWCIMELSFSSEYFTQYRERFGKVGYSVSVSSWF